MIHALDQIRQQYKPSQVQILFVTEALQPGNIFFYNKNSNVFRAIKTACSQVFGDFNSNDEFLNFFKESGCYVDYLCDELINGLSPESRQKARTEGIKPLSERLMKMQPKVIITVMKVLEREVDAAIKLSGVNSIQYRKAVAFPAHSKTNADKCIKELNEIFRELLESGILG